MVVSRKSYCYGLFYFMITTHFNNNHDEEKTRCPIIFDLCACL